MKHLTKRGSIWYVVGIVNGKRISVSTGSSDEKVARMARERIIKLAQAEKWLDLEALKKSRPVASLGEVWRAYEVAMVQTGKVRPRTARAYWSSLGKVCASRGTRLEEIRVSQLTKELVYEYERRTLAGAVNLDRAKRTAASTHNQACGLFSREAREKAYGALNLGDLQPFLEASIEAPPAEPVLPDAELWAKTMAAAEQWYLDGSSFYAVFVLDYFFGLRGGDAVDARWDWIRDVVSGDCVVRVIEVPQSKTETVKRLRVGSELWARMQEFQTYGRGEWILPGNSRTKRDVLAKRQFSQELRRLGYDPARFTKTAHTLRKMVGSQVRTLHGLDTAQAYLGHRSRQTTERAYALLLTAPETVALRFAGAQAVPAGR
jgi:integrase